VIEGRKLYRPAVQQLVSDQRNLGLSLRPEEKWVSGHHDIMIDAPDDLARILISVS